MKNIFYKSKNDRCPWCSIDEIRDEEFEQWFNFKIANWEEYRVEVDKVDGENDMILKDDEWNRLWWLVFKDVDYKKIFKDLIDNEWIKLREVNSEKECW